ncbi:hypothetical protein [Nonomuraea longicatena]
MFDYGTLGLFDDGTLGEVRFGMEASRRPAARGAWRAAVLTPA